MADTIDTRRATPTDSEPAVDSADSLEQTADAAEPEALVDASTDKPDDDLAKARAERDASKRGRRDAEARADALAARVMELEAAAESSAVTITTITAQLETFQKSARDAFVAQHVAVPLRTAASLILASAGDVDEKQAIARLAELGLLGTRSTPAANGGTNTLERRRGHDSPI